MISEGFILSFRWLELYRRQFWVGILFALYLIQFLSLLLNRVDLKEWIITCALIIVIKLNHWRIEKIINHFNQYRGINNKKPGSYFFPSNIRFLFFLIGLQIASGSVLLIDESVIIKIVAVITLFDLILITFSILNEKLNNWLDYYGPDGPRYKLLSQRPQLNWLVNLGRVWQRLINFTDTRFSILSVWLIMITARFLRLWAEGPMIPCQDKGCAKQFENPKLQCNHKIGNQTCSGHVQTWPTLAAPLFTVCNQSQCQHIYPTWQPVADFVTSGELSFKYEPCQFGSNCQNFGLDKGVRFYRIMLLCLDGASAAIALEKIGHWFGMTQNTATPFFQLAQLPEHQKRIRLPQRIEVINLDTPFVKLEVTLFNPLANPPLWAGGYDWVVVVPRYRGDNKEQLEMEAKFALSRVELPATTITESQVPYQPPSWLKRLFYQPRNEELTAGRGIPPTIGLWSNIELMTNIHPTLPVYSVLYIRGFENFIRGLRQ